MLRVTEIFESYQGEGRLAGTPSIFIRLAGCNLRCWFCDTPYSSWAPEGEMIEVADIIDSISHYSSQHIVLTGGEPLLQPEVVQLTKGLRKLGYHLTVETAGTIDRFIEADLMSVSPKRPNSSPVDHPRWLAIHEKTRDQPQVIHRWLKDYDCQFKFVIDHPNDIEDVHQYLIDYPEIKPQQIWLMPQGRSLEELDTHELWLKPAALKHHFQFSSRLHIKEFGNTRGT